MSNSVNTSRTIRRLRQHIESRNRMITHEEARLNAPLSSSILPTSSKSTPATTPTKGKGKNGKGRASGKRKRKSSPGSGTGGGSGGSSGPPRTKTTTSTTSTTSKGKSSGSGTGSGSGGGGKGRGKGKRKRAVESTEFVKVRTTPRQKKKLKPAEVAVKRLLPLEQYTMFENKYVVVPVGNLLQPPPRFLTRGLNKDNLDDLRKRMSGASYDTSEVRLLLMPHWPHTDRPATPIHSAKDLREYELWCVGGNHTRALLQELHDKQPTVQKFAFCMARVVDPKFVELSCSLGALHQHHSHSGTTYDNLDYVRFVNKVYHEVGDKALTVRVVYEQWWLPREGNAEGVNIADAMNKRGAYIRPLACEPGDEWKYMETILEKWESGEIKDLVASGKPRRFGPGVKEFPMSRFVDLAGLSTRYRKYLLSMVASGDHTLGEMGHEARTIKRKLRIRDAFVVLAKESSWDAVQARFPNETTDEVLSRFLHLFSSQKTARCPPSSFVEFVKRAMEEEAVALAAVEAARAAERTKADTLVLPNKRTHIALCNDVALFASCSSVVPPEILNRTSLVVADLPYGCTNYDWDLPLTESKLDDYLSSLKVVLARVQRYTVILFAYRQALPMVEKRLAQLCNAGVRVCTWVKPNVGNTPPSILSHQTEFLVIGMKSEDATLHPDFFRYAPAELRVDTFIATTARKFVLGEDLAKLNTCQKPLGLLSFLVAHYSSMGDTVLDLFSGTGTTSIAALGLRRSAVSVDITPAQVEGLLKRRANLHQAMLDGVTQYNDDDSSSCMWLEPAKLYVLDNALQPQSLLVHTQRQQARSFPPLSGTPSTATPSTATPDALLAAALPTPPADSIEDAIAEAFRLAAEGGGFADVARWRRRTREGRRMKWRKEGKKWWRWRELEMEREK